MMVETVRNPCYLQLRELRCDDRFPAGLDARELIDSFFPKSVAALALDLSQVTSAFYGGMLATCAEHGLADQIDRISQRFFHKLGRLKTRGLLEAHGDKLPRDSRGVVVALIAAIYNASPEYIFNVTRYSAQRSVVRLTGCDRYFRIARTLGIDKQLTWPTLLPFFEGVGAELGLVCTVASEVFRLEDSGACDIEYELRWQGTAQQAATAEFALGD